MAKRTGILKACLAISVVLLVLLAGMPVFASADSTATASSGESSSSSAPVPTGGLEVTGYRLENNNTGLNTTDQIQKNNSLTVVLSITDTRPGTQGISTDLKPVGRLNTDSFTIPGGSVHNTVQTPGADGSVRYEMRFQNMTYTGIGKKFRCDLFYEGNPTLPVVAYELDIHQCVEYVAPSSSDSSSSSSSAVVKGTGFVLKEASYGQSIVYAGQPFTLSVSLLATNGDHSIENVTLGITPAKELTLQDGSSLTYVGTVKPGQSVPAEFKLVPGANVEAGSYTAVIDIKGVDAKTGEAVAAQVSISVPVTQPERFEIFNTQLPTDITAGVSSDGSGMGTVTLVNQGKGTVSNVSVDVQGSGLTLEEGKQYLGHVAGGEQKVADLNILASEPGTVEAKVIVTYENTGGEKKELVYDFSVSVEEGSDMGDMGGFEMGEMEPMPPAGPPIWIFVLVGLGIAGVVVVVIVVVKRRKAKKAASLEDDYDEDE